MDLSGKNYKAFLERQEALKKQYSQKQADKQHSKGKLTALERISLLFDTGTFEEIDAFVTPANQPVEFGKVERTYGDGVIAGHGKINGRLIFAYAQDFTIMGGSLGFIHARKIAKIQEMALKMGSPIIGMMDSGGAVYSPALMDFTFMVNHTSYMFVTGPNGVKVPTRKHGNMPF